MRAATMTGQGWRSPALPPPRRLLRDPLFAFLIAGIAMFVAYAAIEARRTPPVAYTPEIERALVEEFEALAGRDARPADRARMKRDWLTEELLFREAIDRNLHLTDADTRKRLVDKVRYLIAGAPAEPDEAALVDYYSSNLSRYRGEPRTSFEQVFRAERPADAAALLQRLNVGSAVAGDDFWLGRDFPRYGDSMVRGIFGQPFVKALHAAPPGRWVGPIRSPRGWHFVKKREALPAALIPYDQIRDQVRQDLVMAETARAIDAALGRLREKYDVGE
ncbi:hypothetical protein COC42_11585 [Sphingomonas spermidinifaciens]|uniref:Parvulin-like PPIase n=1 Tax=Sphingomonas spermidinifaciens TaxID=1141889 RepID=A0A2A4AYU4_9SPHN|nr:peptidylprolyl isomerase [Sphingomonas spermidinifaciens]PCD02113.1 hypothetical protein COC42_11585 [Sphingomonas spermidinifaciens]